VKLPAAFGALGHRDFRVYYCGQFVSQTGIWMQRVGQAWLVLELTNSAFKLGLITALQFAPVLLFSIPGGAVADRIPKRRLLMVTQSVLMLQSSVLTVLVWTGHVQYWHVAVLATVYGLGNAFGMPTRQAFVADLVGRAHLMNAVALNSAMFNAARLIGPAIAGLLIARYGIAQTLLLNALGFLVVIGALSALRVEGAPPAGARGSSAGHVLGGLQYAAATPLVAFVLVLLLSVSFFVLNFNVIVPLFARHVLHGGAGAFGWLMTSLGAGAITGALTLAFAVHGRPPMALPVVAGLLASTGAVTLAFAGSFATAAATLVVIGFSQIVFQASCNTLLQLSAPDALRGRIMSLYTLVFAGVNPFGSLAVGWMAERFGVPAACIAGGTGGFLSVAVLTMLWRLRPRPARPPVPGESPL
jgi:MFS family permease